MSANLLPCPFCGSNPVFRRIVEEYAADEQFPAGDFNCRYEVDCDNCGVQQSEEYRDDAIALWNSRAFPHLSEEDAASAIGAIDFAVETNGHSVDNGPLLRARAFLSAMRGEQP